MSQNELVWYVALAVAAGGYYAIRNRHYIVALLLPWAARSSDSPNFDQQIMPMLLSINKSFEEQGMSDCTALVRELMWRVMGGSPHDIKAESSKK